ncbi:hypothetical protein II582_04550 [bacterium]|nr:hypothetical protein [bacterium]
MRLTSYSKWQSVLSSRDANQKALEELKVKDPTAYQKKINANNAANAKKNTANAYLNKNFYSDMYIDRSNNLYN